MPSPAWSSSTASTPQNNLAYCETISATNPCVPGDTWVHTSDGPRQVRDLVGKPSRRVDGRTTPAAPAAFSAPGASRLLRLETVEGYALRLTADHRVRRVARLTRYRPIASGARRAISRPGDLVVAQRPRGKPGMGRRASRWRKAICSASWSATARSRADKAVLAVWHPAAAVEWRRTRRASTRHGRGAAGGADPSASRDFTGWIEISGQERVSPVAWLR